MSKGERKLHTRIAIGAVFLLVAAGIWFARISGVR